MDMDVLKILADELALKLGQRHRYVNHRWWVLDQDFWWTQRGARVDLENDILAYVDNRSGDQLTDRIQDIRHLSIMNRVVGRLSNLLADDRLPGPRQLS